MMTERREISEDLSFEALFQPNRDFPYLRAAELHPFDRTAEFRAVNAWWLADLALLSYVSDQDWVRTVLRHAGLSEVVFIEIESTHCIVADDLVVFRGTDDLHDLLCDLDAHLDPAGEGGRVHRGFRAAIDQVWGELAAVIQGREVWFAGHSLGAALATLAGDRHEGTQAVYTFGSPRVGDAEFSSGPRAPVYRVVNNNDIVTRLPPPVGYRHVGRLHYLDAQGVLRSDPDYWERMKEQASAHKSRALDSVKRWLSGDFEAIPYDSLVAHSPVHYATHLWNHYISLGQS